MTKQELRRKIKAVGCSACGAEIYEGDLDLILEIIDIYIDEGQENE